MVMVRADDACVLCEPDQELPTALHLCELWQSTCVLPLALVFCSFKLPFSGRQNTVVEHWSVPCDGSFDL